MSVRFTSNTTGELVVHQLDSVGNNLTRRLAWCASHDEPAWVYNDGSFRCWHEDVTGLKQHLSGHGCGPEFHDIREIAVAWIEGEALEGDGG